MISNDEDSNTCSIQNRKINLKDYLHQESPAKKFRSLLQFWGGGETSGPRPSDYNG